MPVIRGARATGNIPAERFKPDISDKLWMVSPEYAVLAFFARKLKKRPTTSTSYSHFEKEQPSRRDSVNNAAGYTAADTAIVVNDATKFRPGMVVMVVRTGEQMRVTDVDTSTNTITVQRGWGVTAAADLNHQDELAIIGNANQEGAAMPLPITTTSVKKTNYIQIFREPIEVTLSEAASELYAGGSDLVQLRKEHLDVIMKDIERAFIFGEPYEDTSSGPYRIRATGGLRSYIQTNVVTDADGVLTEAEFESFVRDVFDRGGTRKLLIASPLIASAINSWAAGKLVMYPKDKTYGIEIRQYLSVHGQLDIVVEKLFAENATWNGMAFAVDMDNVAYRYLSNNGINLDLQLVKHQPANGEELIKEEYKAHVGFELFVENRFGWLKGVTSYA